MKLVNDDQLLDEQFRQAVLTEIEGPENTLRKLESKRRSEVYNDNVRKHVIDRLSGEMDDSTVSEMKHRTANISICKKIIDKKSRVYRNGIVRSSGDDIVDQQITYLSNLINLNQEMKKVNKYLELYKNVTVQVLPVLDHATQKYKIKLNVLAPHFYDVIEDINDPTKPRVFILSYFNENTSATRALVDGDGRGHGISTHHGNSWKSGDGKDQIIADAPTDQGVNKEYIWWSHKFHFTTDADGNILPDKSPEDLLNPIGELNFIDFHKEQEGQYWSLGGEDLIEGSILVNLLLTDLYFIAKVQGMGLFYAFGKGLPKTIKVGPNDAFIVEMEEGDPTPQIGFATSSPPINDHMQMIEQYVALLLSTNNLEPTSISGNLSVTSATSGIQEMIQKSEVTAEIEDDQEQYRDNEPLVIRLISKWLNVYKSRKLLHPLFERVGTINEFVDYSLQFQSVQPFMSEKEKLEVIRMRKELGLDSMIDLIQRDNPDLSKDEAQERALKVLEDKLMLERQEVLNALQEKKEEEKEEQIDGESNV